MRRSTPRLTLWVSPNSANATAVRLVCVCLPPLTIWLCADPSGAGEIDFDQFRGWLCGGPPLPPLPPPEVPPGELPRHSEGPPPAPVPPGEEPLPPPDETPPLEPGPPGSPLPPEEEEEEDLPPGVTTPEPAPPVEEPPPPLESPATPPAIPRVEMDVCDPGSSALLEGIFDAVASTDGRVGFEQAGPPAPAQRAARAVRPLAGALGRFQHRSF